MAFSRIGNLPLWLLLLFFTQTSLAQSYWFDSYGSAQNDEGLDVAVDNNGNSYYTGYFSHTAVFEGHNLSAAGVTDIFVVKANAQGHVQWAVRAGGIGEDRGTGIVVDGQGNTYVTGYFSGVADFGSTTLTAPSGSSDLFVAKYDPSGNLLWV